jgi:hypothetical protein
LLRTPRFLSLATLLALLVPFAPGGAQHALVSLPLDDPAHVQLRALERGGCAAARVAPFRPYLVGRVRTAVRHAQGEARCRGPILDLLVSRFRVDSVAVADSVPARDTLSGVAPDLAAAVAVKGEAEQRHPQSGVGAAVTLRLTGHGEGEFRPLWRGVQRIEDGTPPAVALLRVRGTVDGGERLVGVVEAYGQTHRRNDPQIRGRVLRRTTGVVDFGDAYVNGQIGPLVLSLGRAREAWLGDGAESIALSAHGPPLDRLLVTGAWRKVEARAVVASLDDIELTPELDSLVEGTPPTRVYRWLIAHALAIRPTPSLEFTLGESAILTRQVRALELSYFNPTLVYQLAQNDSGRLAREQDNLAIFGGMRWRRGPAAFEGEVFIDDLQLDKADGVPNQLAWRLAATMGLPLGLPANAGIEYRRIDNYAYMRGLYSEVHQQYDRPLGSELGPGSDLFEGSAELWTGPIVRFGARLGVWRQGALRIDERPGQRASGNADVGFPRTFPDRPQVQRALLGTIEADFLHMSFPLRARLEFARIEHAANQPAPTALYLRAHLTGTYAFRYP